MAKNYTDLWLHYTPVQSQDAELFRTVSIPAGTSPILANAIEEMRTAAEGMFGFQPEFVLVEADKGIALRVDESLPTEGEGFTLRSDDRKLTITGKSYAGLLYGVFTVLRRAALKQSLRGLNLVQSPACRWRLLNHWDVFTGGRAPVASDAAGLVARPRRYSIFYQGDDIMSDETVRDYCRALASIGINGVAIHNVNVVGNAIDFITPRYYRQLTALAELFAGYGIGLVLPLNFASPIVIGKMETADPAVPEVEAWWHKQLAELNRNVPNIVGFVVKADSEGFPGPFVYGRTQAEGANIIARAIQPFGQKLFWRCFVYNCQQDWRDTTIDRAKSGYDNFQPLDGQFEDNVILQIKNGPQDFQVREPVHPLFGGLEHTHEMLELQIYQEYTGAQTHVCFLMPQFKEILDFHTFARPEKDTVADVIGGRTFGDYDSSGICAVANANATVNWTGHDLAAANLYGFGRLGFDPTLDPDEIAREWIIQTYTDDPLVEKNLGHILGTSWLTYEKYNTPLGLGWLCNNGFHYGPGPDIYEYDRWGTYHRANWKEIGVDRTSRGTGYTKQYHKELTELYDNIETCPENLVLFFYRLPYSYVLKSGKTLIQHIYDTHFEGVEDVEVFVREWDELKGHVPDDVFERVQKKFQDQLAHAKEWRDVINTYFYRRTGIPDARGRKIYE